MAAAGFNVHGIEVRQDVLKLLKDKKPHFWERGLDAKLAQVVDAGRFTFSGELSAATAASVYIITVGTPLDAEGHARVDMISNATRQICEHLKDGALVILRSTVR